MYGSPVIETDEVRMLHDGFIERAVARFDAGIDGALPVIVPFPLRSVESRTVEHLVYGVGVRSGAL